MSKKREEDYTLAQVYRLLGVEEGDREIRPWLPQYHITILDVLSWAHDPGGDATWEQIARTEDPGHLWMARRGPLQPESEIAAVYFDFMRGMSALELHKRAAIALTAFGFSQDDIATVFDWKSMDGTIQSKRVSRLLFGRPRRDKEDHPVRDEKGDVLYVGGAVRELHATMNGYRRRKAKVWVDGFEARKLVAASEEAVRYLAAQPKTFLTARKLAEAVDLIRRKFGDVT